MTGQSVVYAHRLGELAAVGDRDLLGGLAGGGQKLTEGPSSAPRRAPRLFFVAPKPRPSPLARAR